MRDACYRLGLILLALYLWHEYQRVNILTLELRDANERIADLERQNKLHGWEKGAYFDNGGWYAAGGRSGL